MLLPKGAAVGHEGGKGGEAAAKSDGEEEAERVGRCTVRESTPLSRPMSRQPRALAAKVLHGKRPSAAPGRSNVRPKFGLSISPKKHPADHRK